MLLRIRSATGTSRVTVEPGTTGEELTQLILDTVPKTEHPDASTITLSNQPGSRGDKVTLEALKGRKVSDMGFSHGDLLFLDYKSIEEAAAPVSVPEPPVASSTSGRTVEIPEAAVAAASAATSSAPKANLDHVVEPEVDIYWRTQSGKIERGRDPVFCRHGDKGMCDYCMPVEPYDAKYHAENQIKHLSYHAYLRQLLAGRPPSSTYDYPPLTPLSLAVLTPCPSGTHAPFPEGICSKCQPSALTLHSQPFRMVDHVEFATPAIIDSLLSAWRRTGSQRFAFLIGRYDRYEKVPMGVKAIVEAVWEPKQEGEIDGLTIETPWSDEKRVAQIAGWCEQGLGVVGMIYTDLTPDPDDITQTLYKRHAQSYTASGLEMLTSAQFQVSHPMASKASPTGQFSSRWVTCCLTGTQDGQVDVIAWQATEQGEAMVKAHTVEASVDPGIVRVRTPSKDEYIPEVFYSYKNEYGIQVKKPAKPAFPVEYLFVNVTHGFPVSPDPVFQSNNFPVENRPGLSEQSMEVVVRELLPIIRGLDSDPSSWSLDVKNKIQHWLSDWHLITFLCMHGPFSIDEQKLLAQAATAHHHPENAGAIEHLFASDGWRTLLSLAEASAAAAPEPTTTERFDRMGIDSPAESGTHTPASAEAGPKACPHCTYINEPGASDCDVCGLPLN